VFYSRNLIIPSVSSVFSKLELSLTFELKHKIKEFCNTQKKNLANWQVHFRKIWVFIAPPMRLPKRHYSRTHNRRIRSMTVCCPQHVTLSIVSTESTKLTLNLPFCLYCPLYPEGMLAICSQNGNNIKLISDLIPCSCFESSQ